MDWTGYPKDLEPDDLIIDAEHLAAFLAEQGEQEFVVDLLALISTSTSLPARADRLAVAFPREVQASHVWSTYDPTPTAAQLLDALVQVPDTPVDVPAELLPVMLGRMIATVLPTTQGNVNVRHRLDTQSPWRDLPLLTATPACDIDPALYEDPSGARLSIRLTKDPVTP